MRSNLPQARQASPVETGRLKKSLKVRSRSRRGVSSAQVRWDIKEPKKTKKQKKASILGIPLIEKEEPKKSKLINYAGVVNFKKGQSAEGFGFDLWKTNKSILDAEGLEMVKDTFKEVLEKHGVKVKNK